MKEIKIEDIKTQYVLPALANLPYRFKVFTDTGRYQGSVRQKNTRNSTINALLQVSDSEVILLGGGLRAASIDMTLRFLVPVPDSVINEDGAIMDYTFIEDFRTHLEEVFATQEKLTLVANGKTYIGGVATSFPAPSDMAQRQRIGQSFEYSFSIEIAYLLGAINSSDVAFYLDGDSVAIPYTSYTVRRESNLSANIYSSDDINEGKTYAENSVFAVDLSVPALDPTTSVTARTIYKYLMGKESANTPHTLKIVYGAENEEFMTVIFGKTVDGGENVANVARQISFVPYISAEDEDEEDEEKAV
jgi:hypothetical protein